MTVQKINHINNIIIEGSDKKPILTDITFIPSSEPKPVIFFSHGFKGFKDWGHYNRMATEFALQGFVFVKFNFSHNGITRQTPDEFNDLEAFGNNNFSKELNDLGKVIYWIENNDLIRDEIKADELFLIGHSRGGGISILKANEDTRIKKIVSWAAPCDFDNRFGTDEMIKWKESGVMYVENSRTHEQMPMYYQIADDYYKNKSRLNIPLAVKELQIPFMIVHGTSDDVVSVNEARLMKSWCPNAKLLIIEDGDHCFGTCHPFTKDELPAHFLEVLNETIAFLKSNPSIEA